MKTTTLETRTKIANIHNVPVFTIQDLQHEDGGNCKFIYNLNVNGVKTPYFINLKKGFPVMNMCDVNLIN